MKNLKEQFSLNPKIHFLNHGSFGATPKPVFKTYQQWQKRLERQPVLFLGREFDALMAEARNALGNYLHVNPNDLVYIPNATHGVNIVARSLQLKAGDEILTTNHEYGACDFTWQFLCQKSGAKYIRQVIDFPVTTEEEILNQFWAGLTNKTRLIYLSHITSPTALRLPVEKICKRARELGILTLIDGAHAPGQIPLNLSTLDADFYTGNCHKWMLAPKGAAFLYARSSAQPLLEPLVVSWGVGNPPQLSSGSRFLDIFQWTGTQDPSACLSVPAAIQFMEENNWETVQQECHTLLVNALKQVSELTQLPPLYPLNQTFFSQMAAAELPAHVDLINLKANLYDQFKVEIPLVEWQNRKFLRISIQAYNTREDVNALLKGLVQNL